MPVESTAVFLSYASEDAEAAGSIAETLRRAGIEVWFDRAELRGGDEWDAAIRRQIKTCSLFIPIISFNAHARTEGYFRLEWKIAIDRSHHMAPGQPFILPVAIDDTKHTDERIPDRIRDVQWTRLPHGITTRGFVERVDALLRLTSSVGVGPAVHQVPSMLPCDSVSFKGERQTLSKRLWLWAAVAALLVSSALLLLERSHLQFRASEAAVENKQIIAVLPFADMSDARDQEYLADGLSEEIINLLAKIPDLKVIGRTSSFQFKGKSGDLRKISAVLGAAYLLEGSVRLSGGRVRVSVQLIDALSGSPRWSETYDREAADTFKVQDEITGSLVRALQLEVVGARAIASSFPHTNMVAHDAYLHGLHAFNRFDEAGFEEAVVDFKRALEVEPTYVPAAEQLARTYCDQLAWGFVPAVVAQGEARRAAYDVLKLDARSAVAHTVLACVHLWYDWDWKASQSESDIAIALAPHDAFTLVVAAEGREAVGQWSQAVRLCESAKVVDPLTASIFQNIGHVYLRWGRYAEAEAAARRVLQISPTYSEGHFDLGKSFLVQGKREAAMIEMSQEVAPVFQAWGVALAAQLAHRTPNFQGTAYRLDSDEAANSGVAMAEIYAVNGRTDDALKQLDRAYASKDINLWEIKSDPFLEPLENDARYVAFLRKLKLHE